MSGKSNIPDRVTCSVILYTDGACKGNPGRGGWGVLMYDCRTRSERSLYGGIYHTTNNRMELMAVIRGLRALKRPCSVQVTTDSKYVISTALQLDRLEEKGYRRSRKRGLINADLWEELHIEMKRHIQIDFVWVRGHQEKLLDQWKSEAEDPSLSLAKRAGAKGLYDNTKGNQKADELANLGVPDLKD